MNIIEIQRRVPRDDAGDIPPLPVRYFVAPLELREQDIFRRFDRVFRTVIPKREYQPGGSLQLRMIEIRDE